MTNLTSTDDVLSRHEYVFDGVGDRISVTNADDEVQTWRYDCRRWLDEESNTAVPTAGWNCLSVGDWDELAVDDWDTLPVNGCPPPQYTYFYDATGNRTLRIDDAGNHGWSAESRLPFERCDVSVQSSWQVISTPGKTLASQSVAGSAVCAADDSPIRDS